MGVHSVSEVEAIWDAREVASDHEGMGIVMLVESFGCVLVMLLKAPNHLIVYGSANGVAFGDNVWCLFLVLRCQKQYMVKYRGLAHVHNCWIPETQLFIEAPKRVSKFKRKNQV